MAHGSRAPPTPQCAAVSRRRAEVPVPKSGELVAHRAAFGVLGQDEQAGGDGAKQEQKRVKDPQLLCWGDRSSPLYDLGELASIPW